MFGIRTLGFILLTGAALGATAFYKLSKAHNTHKPKKNRVIEVELSEGIEPEDIIITVPRRTKN